MNSLAVDTSDHLNDEQTVSEHGLAALSGTSENLIILCRKKPSSEDVELVRAYHDEKRAQADMELATKLTDDEYWLSSVPMLSSIGQSA